MTSHWKTTAASPLPLGSIERRIRSADKQHAGSVRLSHCETNACRQSNVAGKGMGRDRFVQFLGNVLRQRYIGLHTHQS